ncbi:MAG: hypothetical protein ACXADY_21520 [Candidatus Hodarchaeales archaeon]
MNPIKIVTSLAITGGSFEQWPEIEKLCEQSVKDNSGIAVGRCFYSQISPIICRSKVLS